MDELKDEQNNAPKARSWNGIDEEFDEFTGVAAPPTAPALIEKEYDFGNGPVTIQAKDNDELIQKVLEAQRAQFEAALLAPPTNPIQPLPSYEPVGPPTADDLSRLALEFDQDKFSGVVRTLELALGMPFEQIRDNIVAGAEVKEAMYGEAVGNDFVTRHQNDYYPCKENADKLYALMESRGLDLSPQNLDWAVATLNSLHQLKAAPITEQPPLSPQTGARPVQTALSGTNSVYPENAGKLSVEEAQRLAEQMPLDQLKEVLQSYRRQR